jgi:Bacterial Ig-like domain (group 2)
MLKRVVWLLPLVLIVNACKDDPNDPSLNLTELSLDVRADTLLTGQRRVLAPSGTKTDGSTIALNAAQVTWTSSSASVAQVSAGGVVIAVSAGLATVTATAGGQTATANILVLPTPQITGGSTLSIPLDLPSSIAAERITVSTAAGFAASGVQSNNTASVTVARTAPTLLLASDGEKSLGLLLAAPGGVSAAPSVCGQRLGARSTAVALVMLDPELIRVPANLQCELVQVVSSVPELAALADAITRRIGTGDVFPTGNDAELLPLVRAATRATKTRLMALAPAPVAPDVLVQNPQSESSGIRFTNTVVSSSQITTDVQNRWGRDVWIVTRDVNARGQQGTDVVSRSWLLPADYVPDLSSLSGWISVFRQDLGPASPTRVALPTSAARTGVVIDAYGLGLRGFSSLSTARDYLYFGGATAASALFSVALPVANTLFGFSMDAALGLTTTSEIETLADAIVDVGVLVRCLEGGGGGWCLAETAMDKLSDPEQATQIITFLAAKSGRSISSSVMKTALKSALPVLRILSGVDAAASIASLGYATIRSSVRETFIVTPNGMLGAVAIAPAGGDAQSGPVGTPLVSPVRVQVTNAQGAAVSGARVQWQVLSGGGSLSQLSGTTNTQGYAETRWTLGSVEGTQRIEALLVGTSSALELRATAILGAAPGTVSGRAYDFRTNAGVAGASVTVTRGGATLASSNTNASGAFNVGPVSAGLVDVRIALSGFVPVDIRQVRVDGNVVVEAVPLVPSSATNGGISGTVFDASLNRAVTGSTTVRLYAGMNVTSGTPVASTTTTTGSFAFTSIPAGVYSLVGEAVGFTIGSRTGVSVGGGATTANQHLYLSPTGAADQWRVVLTWGASPSDLDSHLTGPLSNGGRFRVFFGARGSCTVSPFACLDVDVRTGRGPETISISRTNTGVYSYAVHNYSVGNSTTSLSLAQSNARVDLYRGGALVQSFAVPSLAGSLWTVFELDGTSVRTINTVSGNSPPTSIESLLSIGAALSGKSTAGRGQK